ncbi:MAG: UPF0489 family protein [Candidatus Omnitrophica bacterium]|nr:UPF0489 family protein [Candidatus Omnitrophota bacterium]
MKNIFLIENHNEALDIWRKRKIRCFDLVHIDSHLDFGFYHAFPIREIIYKAPTIEYLKRELEISLAFQKYEKDFDKQINIGNYIYPAIREGIVRDLYWVIPGGLEKFKESFKLIKSMLSRLCKREKLFRLAHYYLDLKNNSPKRGIVKTTILGRNFFICILDRLPTIRHKVLLDIDTDFLVIDSIKYAENYKMIGQRKVWFNPRDLVAKLKNKIKQPHIITIAYSVNGGYTPIEYKYLGDEIAYYFSPQEFKKRLENSYKASNYFKLFLSSGNKYYYRKTIEINPTYRVADNNYGFLYLGLGKLRRAEEEFLKIHRVDPKNPASLLGLGKIEFKRRNLKKAHKFFLSALMNAKDNGLFSDVEKNSLLELAKLEFALKNFKKAKELFIKYKGIDPLHPQAYIFLGFILEKEKDFYGALKFYMDASRLGGNNVELLLRMLKISVHLDNKDDIIKYIKLRYKEFIKIFKKTRYLQGAKDKIMKKILVLEKKLDSYV